MNWKKYIKIASGIIITIGIIWAGYYFWQRFNLGEVLFGGPKEEQPTAVPRQKLAAITDIPIFDYLINKKTGNFYYFTELGQVVKINSKTYEQEIVNSQTISKLNNISSSYDGAYAAAKFNYPEFPTFSIFNTVTNSWQSLPENTIAAAWSPNSSKLAYINDKSLKILDLTNNKTAQILPLSQREINLIWKDDQTLLLSTVPTASLPTSIWSVNIKNQTIAPFLTDIGTAVINWSNDGQLGLKLRNQNRTPALSVTDDSGTDMTRLNFVTMPNKCLVLSNKIYCGVPKLIREGIVLPDDYYKKAVYFDDNLYLIDLSTGASKILLEKSDTLIDAEHLELFNNQLLFKNRIDGKLYSLEL
jgi:hypothetical protein